MKNLTAGTIVNYRGIISEVIRIHPVLGMPILAYADRRFGANHCWAASADECWPAAAMAA